MKVSILILAHNEEENIRYCLDSIKSLTDDIIVIDSYSTDKTIEICEEFNCRIFKNEFINHAKQVNWGLKNIDIKYNWIMRLDADEIIPKDLFSEIQDIEPKDNVNGFYMNKRMYWMNKWLRHGRMYPHYILRVFRKGFGVYEEKTEEHLVIIGETGYLKNDFFEENKKNNLNFFTQKHMLTAEGEVEEIIEQSKINNSEINPKLFGNKIQRTRWLKLKIYNHLPLFIRPFVYFVFRYFLCLGFLDGRPGLIFHFLQGFWYRFYIDSRIYEDRVRKPSQKE